MTRGPKYRVGEPSESKKSESDITRRPTTSSASDSRPDALRPSDGPESAERELLAYRPLYSSPVMAQRRQSSTFFVSDPSPDFSSATPPKVAVSVTASLRWPSLISRLQTHDFQVVFGDEVLRTSEPFSVLLATVAERADIVESGVQVQRFIAMREDEQHDDIFDDFASGSASVDEVEMRIRYQVKAGSRRREIQSRLRDAEMLLELTHHVASTSDYREILFNVVTRIAEIRPTVRASIVVCPDEHDAFVIVTSDDENLSNLKVDLRDYPEIVYVLKNRKMLAIPDADAHPVFESVRASGQGQRLGPMALFPIIRSDEVLGVLFLRFVDKARFRLDRHETGLYQVIAKSVGASLHHAEVISTLRAEQVQADRRHQDLKRFKHLFESLADGIITVDRDGKILSANASAESITGYSFTEMSQRGIAAIVDRAYLKPLRKIWDECWNGKFPQQADIKILTKENVSRIIACNFGALTQKRNTGVISFRDVSESRALANELQRTKDFIVSLIDASADGIVAADMDGKLLLVNKGAETMLGYGTSVAIPDRNVQELYADPNTASLVMSRLRSTEFGGVGRLTPMRVNIQNVQGESIPVQLSASMVFQGEVPVATFGILIDLREKLEAEGRLAEAQEKLATSEQQRMLAELAGAAAHELNQPLMSVSALAELLLLRAKSSESSSAEEQAEVARSAQSILEESERMAEIVRKIGTLTRYETKGYVGTQRIIDLDRAALGGGGVTDDD